MQNMKIPMENVPHLIGHWCHIAERERLQYVEYLNRTGGEDDPRVRATYERLAADALKLSKEMHDHAGRLLKEFEAAGGEAPWWISNQLADRHQIGAHAPRWHSRLMLGRWLLTATGRLSTQGAIPNQPI
jgi:hypothetical protein